MDEIKKLYDVLSSKGYYTKSFDDFKVQFQDKAYQDKVFGVVSRDGLYTKSKDEFLSKYSVVPQQDTSKKKEVSEPALPTGGKVGISEAPSEEGGAISKAIGKGLKTALDESKKQRQVAPKSVFGPYGLTRPSEPTAPKISQKIDAGIKVPRSKIQLESSSEVDEIEGFFNAYERGVRQGELADMMALGQTPNRENLKEIARLNKEISSIPSSAAYERFNATDNIGDAISEFIDNPFEITTQLVAESLSALVRHGYSRALAGAAVGAAAGSVVPGIGTVAGINSGYIAGIGVASYNLEMASSIMDSFREAGVDVTDEKSLTEAFDNPETLSRAKSFAQKRAVPIAIFDMFSAGMGGKLLGKPTKTMLAKLGRGVAEVGIQSGLAGAGEATAQVVSGQKINPTAIFSEMIGEVGGGAPDIAIGTMIEKTKQGKKVGEEAVKLDVKPEVLQDMLDISEGAGEITSEQSEQIKKQYEDIQKIKQSVPEEFKKNAEVIESLQQKRALEEAKKGLDPIFAKKIDEQIKALDTKIDNVISKVPAAEELTYRVDYFDPETNKMASKMFATEKEGSAFQRGLTSEQNKYGSKGYYTSAKGVGEVAPKTAPEVPAAPKKPTEEQQIKDIQEGNLVTFTYENELQVPETLKDKISSRGEINGKPYVRVTIAKSLADYELSKAEGVGEVAAEAAPELPATQLAENFKKDFNEGALKKGEYGGARNLGVYDYQGGIVKVVKEKRKLGADQLTLMKERLGDMDNVYIPKAEVDLGEGKSAVVMDKATGIDASKLTKEDIDAIPQEHWDKFEADIRELSKRGVAVDLTKRDNFFYDKDKGFSFIDISGISIEGEPTTKFFVKDGVEMYYPLEQYPFSKKFEGGKKMFENIAEIKKEETAPEVAAPVTELPATPETQKKSIENIIKQEELDISPDQLDRLYDEAVKGGGKIEESQVRKILNVGYLRASRIAEEINDLGVREVKPEAAPEVPAAPEKTQDEVAKEQTKETDLLLGGQAEQRRKDGKYTKDGVEYVRNPKGQGAASEVTGEVRFTNEVSLPFKYKLVEAETLQPSHQDGIRNPLHFIPEAQPKNRNDIGSLQAEESFANNPRFSELGENTNAYSGAPVVNERGEVVQGNNRSAGLRKGYQRNNPQYKNDLAANAEQFGFTREQVEGMKNPVLVREVAVSDQGAIELGNYDAKDLETGGKRRIDPVAVTRRMPFDVKGRIADLFTGEETLNQAIRSNQKRLLELLNPYLNQAQRNTITREGVLTDAGIKDLEAVVQQFLFDNGDTALPDLFENLSATQKEGLRKSLPYIYSAGVEKSIIPEIQEAILAANEYKESGAGDFNAWLAQGDIFNEGKTPRDKYTELELAIARTLVESKTQKEISKKFIEYADKVKDKEADMFEPAKPGQSKEQGVQETFNVKYNAKPISERGGKEIAPKEKPAAEPSAEKRPKEAKREPELPETDKRAEARKKLKDALDDFLNAGIVYDPRSQAEKQVRLTKAIINAIREEAIGAIKDLKKYLKENIGIDISDNDAKYLLIESKKPEYAIQEPAAGEVPVQPEARVSGKVEAGVPPTEPPKVTPEGESPREEKRLSGIKKALVSKEVLDKVDFERTGDKQLLAAGRQIIESGEVKPRPLVNKIVEEGKGVLTPAEVVALITYKADLDTQVENLTAEIEKMEADGQDIGTKGVELKELELDQQNFDIAAVITAQQQSLSFRLRMWMLDSGYNLQKEISQYKKINNGTIPEDVKKRFEEYDAEIQRLKKRIKDVNAEKVDQEGEQAAANIVEDVQREGAILTEEEIEAKVQEGVQKELNKIYEQLPVKKKSKADQAIAALEKIQKRLRNRTYDAALGIPVALIDAGITTIKNAIKAGVAIEKAIDLGINKIKDGLKGKPFTNEDRFRKDLLDGFEAEGIRREKEAKDSPSINEDGTLNVPERFLRQLVRDGVTNIEGMTDAVFQELQPQLPELTKRQVRDAITQYGKTVNPTKDDIRQQIGQAKRIGRLISELEDLQKMNSVEFALKYGKKKPQGVKITEAEKNLKKEIKALAKSLKTNEQNLAEAKSAAKRRIEELQRRIKEKDFSSKEKPVIKADAELEMLYSEKKDLENKFVEEKERARLKNRPFTEKMSDVFQELTTGIPRILVAGFDLSATLVQGVRTLFTKPKIAAGGFIEGLRQFGSIKRNENFLKRYRSSYNGVVAKNSGLAISDVDGKISAKDQIFVIKWANAIYDAAATVVTLGHKPSAQFIKNINPLKASQRAYDGAINYVRTKSFDQMMRSLQNDGYTPESNPEQFKAAADFINTTTGRASLGKWESSAKWLSTVFFSPRKLASEFKLYSPLAILYYGKMPAAVRKRALIDFAKFTGSVFITHLLLRTALQSSGQEQDDDFWDPDSSNFLSFKINGKTISVLGGAKSMIVYMSRFLLGNRYVDQYGVESEFGRRPAKKINTKLDLTKQFFIGKLAPTTGALADYYDQNPDFENDDEILRSLVIPLWLQDANELYKDDPLSMTLMFNFLSVIGANIRKVDVVEVRDKIIFKEKVNGKEVKRIVELTDDQKEEFQDIANSKFQLRLKKLSQEINSAKTSSERAEYTKMAADKAKKDAQEIMERRYKAQFRQFPIEDAGEQDKIMERVKKKLQ